MVLTSLQVPPVLKACFLAVLPISLEQPLRRGSAHRHISLPFSMKKKSFQPPARFPEMRSLNLFPFTCFPLMSKSPCICSDLTSCLCNVTLVLVYLFNLKFLSVGAEQCSPSLRSSNCAAVYFLILTSHFFRKVLIHEAKKGKSQRLFFNFRPFTYFILFIYIFYFIRAQWHSNISVISISVDVFQLSHKTKNIIFEVLNSIYMKFQE